MLNDNDNDNTPIGDPEPAHDLGSFFKMIVGIVGLSLGWAVAFAYFIEPTPVRGATRSGRLHWQIEKAEVAPPSAVPAPPAGSEASDPGQPPHLPQ